jgi:hypothetical protein
MLIGISSFQATPFFPHIWKTPALNPNSAMHNFRIFLYAVYILQHVLAVRGHHQLIYIHSFYTNLNLFFATPLTLANVYINGGGGRCLPFGVCFHQ